MTLLYGHFSHEKRNRRSMGRIWSDLFSFFLFVLVSKMVYIIISLENGFF